MSVPVSVLPEQKLVGGGGPVPAHTLLLHTSLCVDGAPSLHGVPSACPVQSVRQSPKSICSSAHAKLPNGLVASSHTPSALWVCATHTPSQLTNELPSSTHGAPMPQSPRSHWRASQLRYESHVPAERSTAKLQFHDAVRTQCVAASAMLTVAQTAVHIWV